ncbi:unnamed protein product [Parajaminaea phylloscopi]
MQLPTCAFVVTALLVQQHGAHASHIRAGPAVLPSAWTEGEAADHAAPLTLTIHLRSGKEDALDAKLLDIAETGGRWLSMEELRGYTAVDESVKGLVTDWLREHGIEAGRASWNELGHALTVEATVGQATSAFSAQFSHYSLTSGLQVVRTRQYALPPRIAEHVLDVSPLAHFTRPLGPKRHNQLAVHASLPLKNAPAACHHGFNGTRSGSASPACLRELYNMQGMKGTSRDPALGFYALDGGFSNEDLGLYMKRYRPDQRLYRIDKVISIKGGANIGGQWDDEGSLDVDILAGFLAPGPIVLVAGHDTGEDYFREAFQGLIHDPHRPAVLSMSYGADEAAATHEQGAAMCHYARQLVALGTTIVVASGDNGVNAGSPAEAHFCPPFAPTYPSGCQYITSVGGTVGYPERAMYGPEDDVYGKKAISTYLHGYGSKNTGAFNRRGRGYPDMAAYGTDVPIVNKDELAWMSGTSASAPIVAAVFALLNSLRKAAGKPMLGWVNPILYKHPEAFHDVTEGGSFGCHEPTDRTFGFNATAGWDPSTGMGTPNFAKSEW